MKVKMVGEHQIILDFDNSKSCGDVIREIRETYRVMIHD